MTDYVAGLTSPHQWVREDAARMVAKVKREAAIENGVIRWNSNGHVPPSECVALAAHIGLPVNVEKSTRARNTDLDKFLADYRRNPPRLSPEDRAEAMNELGPDAVNVVTGRSIYSS